MRKLCLQERQLRPAERRVSGQPIDAILGLGIDEPVDEQEMPFGEVRGPVLKLPAGGSRAAGRFRCVIAGDLVEGVEVAVTKADPHVGDRQHPRQHSGERSLLLADPIPSHPLRVQPYRDSHRINCGAARSAKPANPYWSRSLPHNSATESDTTNRAASTGSSERK